MPRGKPAPPLGSGSRHINSGNRVDSRLRRQRQCETIWRLGPRTLYELLAEIERYGLGDLDERLARYAALDHDIVRLVGAARFPSPPLHTVGRGR
jgi:hypothetical protein